MHHLRPTRDVAIVAAFAYLLTAIALVVGQRPVCGWAVANAARSAGERYRAQQDYESAARSYLAATSFTLGCRTVSASLFGFHSLTQAATTYSESRYQHALLRLNLEFSRAAGISAAVSEVAESANPYAQLYRPIISAIARAASAGDP